jgi:lipopolysaccharide transport system ATP-binding protein
MNQSTVTPALSLLGIKKTYPLYKDAFQRFLHTASFGRFGVPDVHQALQNISVDMHARQVTAIIGENGSGKSTLLQIIAGTLQPTAGEIRTRGKMAALLELGAGFDPEATGRQNAHTACLLHGIPSQEAKNLVPRMLAFAEIGEFADQPTKLYSSGMFVRLAYAVVAHVDADILIVDEALAVGDAYFQQKCMRHMQEFMRHGTVILVTHDMTAVKSLAQHVIWLHKGEIHQQGDPKTISEAFLKAQYSKHQITTAQNVPPTQTNAKTHVHKVGDWRAQNHETRELIQNAVHAVQSKDSSSFGEGGAVIEVVEMRDAQGRATNVVHGGTVMQICITARVKRQIQSPIVGFILKNRLGIAVFGDHTYAQTLMRTVGTQQTAVAATNGVFAGEQIEAVFEFVMPYLPAAEYALSVAIADGSLTEHKQQHWVDEVLILQSDGTAVHGEMIGVPMQRVSLAVRG